MYATNDKIMQMMHLTGCTVDEAREYLEAEEGIVCDAVVSYRCDAPLRQASEA